MLLLAVYLFIVALVLYGQNFIPFVQKEKKQKDDKTFAVLTVIINPATRNYTAVKKRFTKAVVCSG